MVKVWNGILRWQYYLVKELVLFCEWRVTDSAEISARVFNSECHASGLKV